MERYKKITSLVMRTKRLTTMLESIDNMYTKEDVIIDVYIKCKEKDIPVDKINYALVKNHIKNMIRKSLSLKRNRNNLITKDVHIENMEDESVHFVENIINRTCEMNCLTLNEFKIFELYYKHGYTHEEISREMKMNRNTISNILKRCIDKIKKEME